MLTVFDWPYTIFVTFVVVILLEVLQRTIFRYWWPKQLRVLDIATIIMWWNIEAITFQTWHRSLLVPIVLMFVLWGIGLALFQGFIRESFDTRRFWMMWWRIVGFGSLLIMIALAVFAYLVTK